MKQIQQSNLALPGRFAVATILIGTAIASTVQLMGGKPGLYIEATSLLPVISGITVALASTLNRKPQLKNFAMILRWESLANSVLGAGLIGTIIAMIHVMMNLDKPDQIGHGLAKANLPFFYAMLVWIVAFSMNHHRTAAEYQDRANASPTAQTAVPMLIGFCAFVVLTLATFIVLFALKKG